MMNTVRKSENLLPFPVISAAANGDTTAMCAILKHYEGYIAKLCTRTLKDDAGNTYSYVDEEECDYMNKAIVSSIIAIVLGYLGSALGYEIMNWPQLGPILAIVVMGSAILTSLEKDK